MIIITIIIIPIIKISFNFICQTKLKMQNKKINKRSANTDRVVQKKEFSKVLLCQC